MAPVGYGENAWIGVGEEVVWGTPVTRTAFLEILSENIRFVVPKNARGSLRTASRRYYIPGKKSVEGGVRCEMLFEGFEKVLKHAIGAGVTSALAGGAYQHTFNLAAQPPVGLTVEVNRDVCSFVYEGCQVQSLTIENAVEGTVQLALELLGENEVTGAASVPTFPADKPIHWEQVTTITTGADTVQAENLRLNLANTLAADRYKLGSRLRKGIGRGGRRAVSGSFVAEFEDMTQYNNFVSETEKVITIVWTGAVIGGGNSYKLQLNLPRCVLQGETPAVGGPGPIKATINFDAFYDVTNSADELSAVLVNTTSTI